MGTEAASRRKPFHSFQQLQYARHVLQAEADALLMLSERLGNDFCRVVDLLYHCPGSTHVSGMGKAGLVGQKIAATLTSTGTRSHFLHPAEALHGDLGRVHRDDILVVLSYSGETEEIVQLLPALQQLGAPIVAVTGHARSQLGRAATVTLDLGPLAEACSLGLAPSTSTTAMLALGDALALVISRRRQFGPEDFARFHPGGSLGRKLAKVDQVMRPLRECRVAAATMTVREVLVQLGRPGRRTGAVMVTNACGALTGIFTDSDLAKLLEAKRDAALDAPIGQVMTASPTSVAEETKLTAAVDLLVERKISELPVVNSEGKPRGLIDITDVVGLLPNTPPDSPFDPAVTGQPASRTASREDRQTVPFPKLLPRATPQ